jgi:NAD(P)-dependent dehydrogenase (short-subunit alcohol dehydrogenase family)
MGSLQGKSAIVTGGGMGIGRAISRRYAAEGARVVIFDINADAANETVALIEADGGAASFIRADLGSPDDIAAAAAGAIEACGQLDILCNNAGVMDALRPPLAGDLAQWNFVFAINVTAPYLLSQAVLPHMIANQSGAIVNIASIAGITGGRAGTAYTSSKHALIGLMKNIAYAHAEDGIRCNAICPGGINTGIATRDAPRNDFGAARFRLAHGTKPRHGEPDEIARVAAFLASDDASFVNGVAVPVDGGWMAA